MLQASAKSLPSAYGQLTVYPKAAFVACSPLQSSDARLPFKHCPSNSMQHDIHEWGCLLTPAKSAAFVVLYYHDPYTVLHLHSLYWRIQAVNGRAVMGKAPCSAPKLHVSYVAAEFCSVRSCLLGDVKGRYLPGRPGSSFNDVALSACRQ